MFFKAMLFLLAYVNGCSHNLFSSNQEQQASFESEADFVKVTHTPKEKQMKTGQLLVILAVSSVSLALVLIITHELYTCRCDSNL